MRDYNLISISTPEGKSKRFKASTVLALWSKMSINLLCVLISNCSRESLLTWGDLKIVKTFFSVGRGIGPETLAPVYFAVSTIFWADWSNNLWSNAFKRILIFCFAMVLTSFSLSLCWAILRRNYLAHDAWRIIATSNLLPQRNFTRLIIIP